MAAQPDVLNEEITVNKNLATTVELNDGVEIPVVGLGTYATSHIGRFRTFDGKPTYANDEEKKKVEQEDALASAKFKNAVKVAVRAGYRHIDGAEVYRTSAVIGDALKELYDEGVVARKDLFITTKNAPQIRTVDGVKAAVAAELKAFQTDYIDLYLIHAALTRNGGPDVLDVYRALHELKKEGKIRSVGVSNFLVSNLEVLEKQGLPTPSVNQIECHPFLWETEIIDYCSKKGITIEAYCPIAQANKIATSNEMLAQIAAKYKKTWSHVLLRWG